MDLVNLPGENKLYSNAIMAGKLGVSEDMLSQMLNDLAGFGYVENINRSCSINNQCKKCASHSCSPGSSGSLMAMWMLTGKGWKAIEKKLQEGAIIKWQQ